MVGLTLRHNLPSYYHTTTSTSSFKLYTPISSLYFHSSLYSCNLNLVLRPRPQSPRGVVASVSFNPQGNYDLSLLDDDTPPQDEANAVTLPPKEGRFEVVIDTHAIRHLLLQPFLSATSISSASQAEPTELMERTIGFTINYTREDPYDTRELSEIPDVRLWFVNLDATYPWLPVLLDWRAGELARYAAMLVPHQISTRLGVVFNPEALELFVMNKVFIVYSWLKQNGVPAQKARVKTSDMARMLGFGIGDDLFNLIDHQQTSP